MKYILTLVFLILTSTISYSQTDSLVCFTKKESLTIVNKIRLLQDSLAFSSTVITNQDGLIAKYTTRNLLFQQQLVNRDSTIAVYEKQAKLMEDTIQNLQPKWYDNKFLWLGGGFAAALITIIIAN